MGILTFQDQVNQPDPGPEKNNLLVFILPEKKPILIAREDYRLTSGDLARSFTDTHINKQHSLY